MNLEEIDQLIRMSQVLRVRARNLARDVAAAKIRENGSGVRREGVKNLEAAAELAGDMQAKLEKTRDLLS